MNIALWFLQFLLAIYFIFTGIQHFLLPPGLPPLMAWMYDLPAFLHYFSGTAEILAGLGLVLPGLTRIQTRLTPLAALGLVLVMIGAVVWHLLRNEFPNIVMNLILAGIAGFVAYGRWRLSPLKEKGNS
jgi:uncharacterized membrane protein YphA (DoxX/SURF4 family)